jgi:hypothetical protein
MMMLRCFTLLASCLVYLMTCLPFVLAETQPLLAAPPQTQASQALVTDGLTRAQLSHVLVEWFKLPKLPYSVFAVFTDVPLNHPDYVAIDAVRRQHLLLADDTGQFYPDTMATQRDAWLALAKLLFPKPSMSDTNIAALLAPLTGIEGLPRYERVRVARLVSAQLLGQPPHTHLNPDAPLSARWMSDTLATLKTNHALIRDQEKQTAENANPSIPVPANTLLSLTPSQAISSDTIALGSQYYFQLVAPVQLPDGNIIPKDSSTRAIVVEIDDAKHDYTLQFDALTSAQTGQRYAMVAQSVIHLLPRSKLAVLSTQPEKENKSLLITGSRLEVVTQRLPDAPSESPTTPPLAPEEVPPAEVPAAAPPAP